MQTSQFFGRELLHFSIVCHEAVHLRLDIGGLGINSSGNALLLETYHPPDRFPVATEQFLFGLGQSAIPPVFRTGIPHVFLVHDESVPAEFSDDFDVILETRVVYREVGMGVIVVVNHVANRPEVATAGDVDES